MSWRVGDEGYRQRGVEPDLALESSDGPRCTRPVSVTKYERSQVHDDQFAGSAGNAAAVGGARWHPTKAADRGARQFTAGPHQSAVVYFPGAVLVPPTSR